MVYKLQILNSDATLNNFFEITTARFSPGYDLKIVMRIIQPEKSGIRYIPESGATFSMDFKKSDGTTITKNPSVLNSDDRSILEVSLDETETADLIGQNLVLKIDENGTKSTAIAQMGLKVESLSGC